VDELAGKNMPHIGPKDRPHGHLGSASTKKLAKEAVDKTKLGKYFQFLKAGSILPVVYAVIAYLVHKSVPLAIVALLFSFVYHFILARGFAERSMIGLNKCEEKSFGRKWAEMFIAKTVITHLLIMTYLIVSKPLGISGWYFLAVGIVLIFIDRSITNKHIPDLAWEQKKTAWAEDKMMRD
jgi:hypothetical protein